MFEMLLKGLGMTAAHIQEIHDCAQREKTYLDSLNLTPPERRLVDAVLSRFTVFLTRDPLMTALPEQVPGEMRSKLLAILGGSLIVQSGTAEAYQPYKHTVVVREPAPAAPARPTRAVRAKRKVVYREIRGHQR